MIRAKSRLGRRNDAEQHAREADKQRAKRGSEMLDRLMGALIAITVVLASSSVAFAQNGKQGPQKAKAPATSNKPFDAHDLSGFWDMTNVGRPPGALNVTSNNRPPMTP